MDVKHVPLPIHGEVQSEQFNMRLLHILLGRIYQTFGETVNRSENIDPLSNVEKLIPSSGIAVITSEIKQDLIKECVQLVVPQLPSFECARDFHDIILRAKELLSLKFIQSKIHSGSNYFELLIPRLVNAWMLHIEVLWPAIVIEAVFERCNKTFTRLIIAAELSGDSSKVCGWIREYVVTDAGKAELDDEVKGLSPIISVAARGSLEALSILADAGAGLNEPNCDGNLATSLAAHENRIEMLVALRKLGAYVSTMNRAGYTPFHIAVCCGHKESIQWLNEHAPDSKDLPANNDMSPLETAIADNNVDLVECLLSFGVKMNLKGDNRELKSALDELSEMRKWEERNLELEGKALRIIELLKKHSATAFNEELEEYAHRLELKDIFENK